MKNIQKHLLLFLFCLALTPLFAQETPAVDYSIPRTYEIGGIQVSGVEYLDAEILVKLSGLYKGKEIAVPGDDISNAIKNLWKQGLFSNVQIFTTDISGNKIYLDIVLKERPRLSKYKFTGIKKGEAEDLREMLNLARGKVVTDHLKISTINIIKKHYIEKGYLNATVGLEEIPDTALANTVILIINIDKGEKVKIENIRFHGNEEASDGKLRSLMSDTKEKTQVDLFDHLTKEEIKEHIGPGNIFNFLANLSPREIYNELRDEVSIRIFSSSKFQEKKYEQDKQKIIDYYNTKGFRDAQIAKDSVYTTARGNLIIDLTIDEGSRYYFGDITFKGNTKYPDSLLRQILAIEKGQVYNPEALDRRLYMNPTGRDISSLYMDNGYLFFQVTPVEVAVENNSIDIAIQIYEGAQATIDKITIVGNSKTNEHVIRRELRTLPGQKFSRSDIIRSQREIANLGYFDPEKIAITPTPHPEKGTVDIEYRVEEKPSDKFELQATWGGRNYGFIGTLGFSFNNFSLRNMFKKDTWLATGGADPIPSGDGQRLSLRVQSNGRYYSSVNFSFTEPWLGGKKPNALSLSTYYTRWTQGFTSRESDPTSIMNILGATAGLGTRLSFPDDFFVLQSAVDYQHFNLENWFQFPIPNPNGGGVNGRFINFSLRETLVRNSIDQPLYPRRGSNLSLTLKLTPPYSAFMSEEHLNSLESPEKYKWLEYHKWRFNAEWYTPLVGNLVLKTGFKSGFLGYYNSTIGLSPFERFELGGDGLSNYQIYGKDVISLRGYDVLDVAAFQRQSSAAIFNKYTLELRYPFTLNPSSTIYGLIFAEGGNAWLKFDDYNPFDIKRSAGVGLRFFLPMFGLVGVDYGIGFDKNKEGNIFDKGKISFILGFEPE